jgi:hypothetical protein
MAVSNIFGQNLQNLSQVKNAENKPQAVDKKPINNFGQDIASIFGTNHLHKPEKSADENEVQVAGKKPINNFGQDVASIFGTNHPAQKPEQTVGGPGERAKEIISQAKQIGKVDALA